ncbi:MAG: NAD(P)-dependent alcohol dehydrogenase [Roseiflexaceae bacterium]
MHAMTYRRYGGPEVLQYEQVEQPTPGPQQVLVQVHAAALNAADSYLLHGEPAPLRLSTGLFSPKNPILGADIAGRIVAVGSAVSQFQVGDAVYGDLSGNGLGGFAEYVCAPAAALAHKPATLSFEQAAAVPMAAVTALQGLRLGGQIEPGQEVLIHGASGGVGMFALQIAKAQGAHVTAVCSSRNIEQAHSLGADQVIDYTTTDFVQQDQRYHLVLVANGQRTLSEYCQVVRPSGRCIVAGGNVQQIFAAMLLGPLYAMRSGLTVRSLTAKPNQNDLRTISAMIDAGTIRPIIERSYPLQDLPDALRYHAEGHARGKIVITIAASER